jgi:hypothetical protein
LTGRHGALTAPTQQAGWSRQAASEHAQRVQQAVTDRHAGGPSRDDLLRDNARLRDENRQLGAALENTIDFPEAKQRRFVAVAAALGLSLTPTLVLLAIVRPAACCPSRATLGRWVQDAAARARRVLPVLDHACRGLVATLGLDETFCHRHPLLIGVEPRRLAWRIGWRAPDRTGETWCQALLPWSRLTDALVDGGSGLRRGLELVQQTWRRLAPRLPPVPLFSSLDNVPIHQEGQGALHRVWQAAERLGQAAEAADQEVARADRPGRKKSGPVKRALLAWAKAERALTTAEQRERAWQRARAARELFRPDGRLNDRAGAAAEIAAAVRELPGERWAKTCRMLQDPRALTFLDRLAEGLVEAEPRPAVREAVVE